jgi:hypothetical protein
LREVIGPPMPFEPAEIDQCDLIEADPDPAFVLHLLDVAGVDEVARLHVEALEVVHHRKRQQPVSWQPLDRIVHHLRRHVRGHVAVAADMLGKR